MEKYTTTELCTFLKQWGTEFKTQGTQEGISYYETCVDGYQALENKKLLFYTDKAHVSKALVQLAQGIELEIKGKYLPKDFQIRADCFKNIAERILVVKAVQTSLF